MSRQRLTITLDKEILKRVDSAIDGAKIRNRSHAIEYLLQNCFSPQVSQALILAGGKGLKMRPFTYEMPKCLLPVAGKPLLEHVIELFEKHNIADIIISVGHLGEKIKQHFGDGKKFGVRIRYIDQDKKEAGTAGPVLQAKKYLRNKPFILYYGDVLADINLNDLIDFHITHQGIGTMALTSIAKSSDWGVVALQGARILHFQEKPGEQKAMSHLINAGVYIFEPEIFEYLKDADKKLEDGVFTKLAQEGKLFGYSFEGKWLDVGTPENYERAVKEWKT